MGKTTKSLEKFKKWSGKGQDLALKAQNFSTYSFQRNKMGRSWAAKNQKLRESRQELVQNILAGKIFCNMSCPAVMGWFSFKNTSFR